jgi:hypothetical protein
MPCLRQFPFVVAHPHLGWTATLLTNLGLSYYQDGYFSKAIDPYQSNHKGVALTEIDKLDHQVIRRSPGQTIPVPTIVHWKIRGMGTTATNNPATTRSYDLKAKSDAGCNHAMCGYNIHLCWNHLLLLIHSNHDPPENWIVTYSLTLAENPVFTKALRQFNPARKTRDQSLKFFP